jgi:hypothetical protein
MDRFSMVCRCGRVRLEISGTPILHCICYCKNCQEGGRRLQALVGADIILGSDGGTDYVVYRKDRVCCVVGGEYLEEHRLEPEAPTRRMNARCCNTPMFLDFAKGHWLSIYRNRLPGNLPPPTMRTNTAERPSGVNLPADMANYPGYSGKFMLKLLLAWVAMGFRRPKIEGVLG